AAGAAHAATSAAPRVGAAMADAGAAVDPVLAPSSQPPSWKKLSPPASPSARAAHAMAYDPVSRKVVLFGGYDAFVYLNETWTFAGNTWRQEAPAGSPSPRAAASMAYDTVSQRLVLFGGYDGTYLGDTWLWDGATSTWTSVAAVTSPPAVT